MKTEQEIEQEILNQVAHLRWAASQGFTVPIVDVEELPINPNDRTVFPEMPDDEIPGTRKGGIRNCSKYRYKIFEGEDGYVEQPRHEYNYTKELQATRIQIDTIMRHQKLSDDQKAQL
jgi:hypothetical protein